MPLSDNIYRTTTIHVDETSDTLNIILHALYHKSLEDPSPSLESIITAIDRMSFNELNPQHHITPSEPLHTILLGFAAPHPLEVYTLAARYDIHDVAQSASSHLLSYALDTISDDMATRMGAIYLNRLVYLQTTRSSALKRIVFIPPSPHVPTSFCGFVDQQNLTRAWALVASFIAWDSHPGL